MKSKSITKKRASSRKDCPREDIPTRGNSPDWYTREELPYKGENFNALTSLSPQPGVMFEEGVSTNAAVMHYTIIHPPVDRLNSFYKKAADFYAEIREKNSGAANYNVMYLAAYMYNVGVLHALAHAAARALKAVRSVMPSSADSPYILSYLVGCKNYEYAASQLAVFSNRYTLLAKDIENLPLPHVTAFDRSRFLYSSIFSDTRTTKPSLVAFIPLKVIEMVPGATATDEVTFETRHIGYTAATGSSILDAILTLMEAMLERITTNSIYTIIRGDIRNAFGNTAYWEGLVQLPATPLSLIPEDVEVMSQLENLSLIPRDDDASLEVTYHNLDGKYVLDCEIDGINDSPSLSRLWCDNNLVNYHGDRITDGELLAITRMMYVGEKVNRLTKTDARITASSGNTVYHSGLITAVSSTSGTETSLAAELMKAQTSTVQSTMKEAFENLTFAASNIAHFPMLLWSTNHRGYMWNTDNYAIVSNVNLHNMTVIANRSLWDIHLPRGSEGRLQRKA